MIHFQPGSGVTCENPYTLYTITLQPTSIHDHLFPMSEPSMCLGHGERTGRKNKIKNLSLAPSHLLAPDENIRVLIKKGPISVETSLKELEKNYASKSEWKVIEEGGVLSIPVEEFRMINPPKPDHA